MSELKLINVRAGDLIPYENNPRHNDGAVEAVAESVKQCGYIAPIVVDENMVVLAGHTRLKALIQIGGVDSDLQVEMVSGLSEEQKKKYRLLDNKTNEFAVWDFDKLKEEAEGLDFGFDFGIDSLLEKGEHIQEYKESLKKDKEPKSKMCTCPRCGKTWEE